MPRASGAESHGLASNKELRHFQKLRVATPLGFAPHRYTASIKGFIFFYKVFKAEIEFFKDGDGKIEKVMIRQGLVKLDGKRIE